MFTHAPPQLVVPPVHPPVTHAPATHDSPVAHACPQLPQFAASPEVSTHAVPHAVSGGVQLHLPAEQKSNGARQTTPQSPQSIGLFCTSVQREPVGAVHIFAVVGHEQVPPVQGSPEGQTVPHAPQLRGSVLVSAHRPPHVVPPEHVQTPETQLSTVPHARAHDPQ